MGYKSSRKKHSRNILYKSKNRRCTTVISHVNSNESNNLNMSNGDNVIETSKTPHSNVQNGIPFNTLINLQKLMDKKSSVSIKDGRTNKTTSVKKFHLIKIKQK